MFLGRAAKEATVEQGATVVLLEDLQVVAPKEAAALVVLEKTAAREALVVAVAMVASVAEKTHEPRSHCSRPAAV